jgi:adenosylmethionine-8-amino-7-oxononanoate aminotransferase
VLTTEAVYAAFYDDSVARGFLHSHSYTGNPLACRAALATLELFEQTDAITANRALAHRLDGAFAPLSQHGRVRHARRQGMIWAWDLQTSLPDFSRRYSAAALERGLLLRPIGNTLYAMPPYALDEEAVQHLAARALASLEDTQAQETLP